MKIEILPSASEELAKLPRDTLEIVDEQILKLANNPHPPEAKVLSTIDGLWYLSNQDYRIIYQIDEVGDRILIVKSVPMVDP